MHVLPKRLSQIRHYGLFANGNRAANIARARELLAVPPRVMQHNADAPPNLISPAHSRRHAHAAAADDHYRDLRAQLPAEASSNTRARHLMSRHYHSTTTLTLPIFANPRPAAPMLTPGPPDSPALATQILSRNVHPTCPLLNAQAKRLRR
jgi:hypothetical protein